MLNKKSGMLGISGISSDDRDLAKAAAEGNERALLTRKMLWYQIRKYIGSYVAALDGVDAIVFTGGIGENGQFIARISAAIFPILALRLTMRSMQRRCTALRPKFPHPHLRCAFLSSPQRKN